MKKVKNISFGIFKISEIKFSYQNPSEISRTFKDAESAKVSVLVKYFWNLEKDLFAVGMEINYNLEEIDSKNNILTLGYLVEFKVNDLAVLLMVKGENDFEINETLETTLVAISLSTGRGILFEKTKGTIFNKFILPIMDPKDLILSPKIKEGKSSVIQLE